MSTYLDESMITDKVADGISMTNYLKEADQAIEDLAEMNGVLDTDDIDTPVHYKLRRYGIVYALMRLAQDRIGAVSPDTIPESNKYLMMYGIYKKELDKLEAEINYDMITGNVSDMAARVTTITAWRG